MGRSSCWPSAKSADGTDQTSCGHSARRSHQTYRHSLPTLFVGPPRTSCTDWRPPLEKTNCRRQPATSYAAALVVLDQVQAALLLGRARPAAVAFVLPGPHRLGARPAADAREPLVVQRVVRHVVLQDELPDL